MATTVPTAPMEPTSEPGRRRKQRQLIAYSLIAIILIAVVAGTAYVLVSSKGPQLSRSLRIGLTGQDAQTLNPNDITLTLEFVVVYNIYSTLTTRDASYNVVGDLAYAWDLAADNVTWTFHLVQNAFFTDPSKPTDRSHPVTADDVVFSYNMLMQNDTSGLSSYVSTVASVNRIDAYTVQIVTTEPYAAMDSTLGAVPIFPKYLWAGIADPVTNAPPVAVGSGALYYDPNSNLQSGPIILRKNPNYYADAQYCNVVRPDEIRLLYFSTGGQLANSFTSGQDSLDVTYSIPTSVFQNGLSPPQGQIIQKYAVEGGFVGEIVLNQITPAIRARFPDYQTGFSNPLLLNPTVRKAVAMSIDKAAIVKYALLGLGTVADTLGPASNPWHYPIPPADRFMFDTTAARKLLNDAGWNFTSTGAPATSTTTPLFRAGPSDPLQFHFYMPNSHPEFAVAAANITRWLAETGIQTLDSGNRTVPGYEVKSLDAMGNIWKAADFDMWIWDWVFSPFSDPSTDVMSVQITDSIPDTSDSWYSNATYDALYNDSLVTRDLPSRRALTDTMQRMLYENAHYILPYYANDLYATTSSRAFGYGWTNWGDWTQQRGLVPDSDNPSLWFRISPPDNPAPTISSFTDPTGTAGTATTLSVTASDANDATLSYIWNFGDGSAAQTTSTNSVSHTYAGSGNYSVKVRVKDGEWPVCASAVARIGSSAVSALRSNQSTLTSVGIESPSPGTMAMLLIPWTIGVVIGIILTWRGTAKSTQFVSSPLGRRARNPRR